MKRTSLYEKHLALKAKMVNFSGWEMPVQYTSVKDETVAVRESVGVFDVSHMGEFFVEGPDAIAFCDYLVTNDFKEAAIGKAVYSPLCREDGTVIDDLILYKLAEQKVLICVNASNIDKDFDWMTKQVGSFNVNLTNQSEKYSLLALQGPKSFEILKAILPGTPDLEYYSIWSPVEGTYIARTGYTGEDGFELFSNHQQINNWWNEMLSRGVTPCGLASRDVLRLEVAYPLYGHELNDETTPLDAGLKWTVKMKKERFIGKKALESYDPKFSLIKIGLNTGIPREKYPVCLEDGTVVGEVTSGTLSVKLNHGIAFARVKKGTPTDKLYVDIRNKKYPATLFQKAFVTGGHKK